MSDERIDSIVNRQKVQSDIDFLSELLSKVLDKIKEVNSIKGSFDAGKGFAETGKQAQAAAQATENLAQATGKLTAAEKAMESVLGNIDQKWRAGQRTIEENIKLQIQYESQIKKVNDAIKTGIKDIGSSGGAIPDSLVKLREEQQRIKLAMGEVNQTLKAQLKEVNAAEGSYDAMNQELGQMRNLFRQLSAEQRGDPLVGGVLLKNIGVLDGELKKIDATMGNFQRNVGNYKSGFNGLGNSINQITRELPAFTMSAQTGFLAISNNLPILFDEISRTKNEIKALRAEGQKVPGLFSQLTKSIFSWGTALSVGVTLLTIKGKDIVKFFENLFKGKEVMDEAVESQKLLNKSLEEGNGAYQSAVKSIDELRINVDLAKKGLISKTDVVKQYNEGIGKTVGQVKSLEEVEDSLIKKGDAYVKMMLYKSAANIALEEAAKKAFEAEQARQKGIDEFVTTGSRALEGLQGGFGNTLVPNVNNKSLAEQNRKKRAEDSKNEAIKEADDQKSILETIAKKFQEDAAKIASDNKFDFFGDLKGGGKGKKEKEDKIFEEGDAIRKANFEVQKQVLSDRQRINQEIVNNDEAAFLQRTEAAKKYLAATQALNKLEYDYKISDINTKEQNDLASAQKDYKNIKEREKAIRYITEAAKAERLSALQKFNSDQAKINDDYNKNTITKLREYLKKNEEERLKHEDNVRDIASGNLKNEYDNRLAQLDQSYAAGLMTEKQYNRKRLLIQYEYEVKSLKQQIDFAKQRIQIAKDEAQAKEDIESFDKLAKAEQDLSALQIQLTKKTADFRINQSKRTNDQLKKDYEDLASWSKLAVDFIGQGVDLLSIKYEKEKNQLQEQIDLIEKKKKTEIDAINATTDSAEEKAAKIAIINIRADAQQKALEQRQRIAQQKQARFEKALTIASIIQETALAVVRALGMKPYTPANIAMAVGVGALGAAKLAVAAATPIPQYAEGVGVDDNKSHPGGLAVVGDGGKKELVVTPSGKSYITPDKSTLVNLPKGTKVFPDANEAMDAVKNAAFNKMPVAYVNEHNYTELMVSALSDKLDKLTETVKNKESIQLNATRAGLSAMHKRHNNFWDYIGTNVR